MDIFSLIGELKDNKITVELDGDDLQLSFESDEISSELITKIKANKQELIAYLRKYAIKNTYQAIKKLEEAPNYPISDAQRRLWILSQFQNGSQAYNLPGTSEFRGDFDITSFAKAVESTIERHEILRTVIREDVDGEAKQWVLNRGDLNFSIDFEDFRSETDFESRIGKYIKQDNTKAFDLQEGPLFRASLLHIADDHYVFYLNMHHIISDGWSMGVLVNDVLAYYEHYKNGQALQLPELKIQYKDYTAWQREMLEGGALQAAKDYWLDQLKGTLAPIDLPGQRKRPKIKTYNGKTLETFINKSLTAQLKAFSQREGGSLFMTLLALWNVLFHRYTHQEEIIVGSPVAGRNHPDLEHQIGFYVNMLAYRNQVDSNERFIDFYERIKDGSFNAYKHQAYPFDRLIDDLQLRRDTSRTAIFDIMVILQNAGGLIQHFDLDEKEVDQIKDLRIDGSRFDLEISFEERGAYLSFQVNYNTDLYESATVHRMIKHFKILVEQLLLDPKQKIGVIDFLTVEEKRQLLSEFNQTQSPYPEGKTILDLIQEQVRKTPDVPALVFEDNSWTYVQLDQISSQWAHFLIRHYQISKGDFVGLELPRTEWLIVAMLGTIKAGGVYVPIDPKYPASRKSYIKEDTNCKLLVDELVVNTFKIKKNHLETTLPRVGVTPQDLAYIIYTSGSTGQPKGVMAEHRNVVACLHNIGSQLGYAESTRVAATANVTFDTSVLEIFGTLFQGKQVILFSDNTLGDPFLFVEKLISRRIEVLQLTPSRLQQLGDFFLEAKLPDLRCLLLGGESFPQRWFDLLKKRTGLRTVNVYGPTEDTVWSTAYPIKSGNEILVGTPLANEQVYILNEFDQLQPIDVIGEICIAGVGTSRGYLNRSDLTGRKFVVNPFRSGQKLYRTGDLGCRLADGNIRFIGRKDDQVKVRGYRIELGEIEYHLQSFQGIKKAVVLAKSVIEDSEQVLIAYFVAEKEVDNTMLRQHLGERLPEYMITSYFIQLEAFELTPNGKVDKKSLPNPDGEAIPNEAAYVAPSNEMEERLVGIWQKILKREKIGMRDDFFLIGGHSITATKLIAEYHKAFKVKLPLHTLFENPTLRLHVDLIAGAKRVDYQDIPKASTADCYPLSEAQKMIWLLSQHKEGSLSYVMPTIREVNQNYDVKILEKALYALLERHEILRTVFRVDENGEIRQCILSVEELGFTFEYLDVSDKADPDAYIESFVVERDYLKVFDLEKGPLFRAGFFQKAKDTYVFYFTFHHIITDGWSLNILTRDLMRLYEGFEANREPTLPVLNIQYKDYAVWQQANLEKAYSLEHRNYWIDKFQGDWTRLTMPFQKNRPKFWQYEGRYLSTFLSKKLTHQLRKFSRAVEGSSFITLLATWQVLFYHYTQQTEFVFGSPVAGRDHTDLKDQIGCFINTIVLRNQIDPEDSFIELYEKIKVSTLEAYAHQAYPFEKFVRELDFKRDPSRNNIFDIMLVDQETGADEVGEAFDLSELDKENPEKIVDLGMRAVKFDFEMHFYNIGDYTNFRLKYNVALHDREMIDRMIAHFRQLLTVVTADPYKKLSAYDFLSDAEKNQLIHGFNEQVLPSQQDKTVLDLFDEQVSRLPESIGLQTNKVQLTYMELDKRSNQLAHYLKDHQNIKPDDRIGVMLERDEWMIITLLAILKTGGAYVPIDPGFPLARLNYIKEDSGCKVVIDTNFLDAFKSVSQHYTEEKLKTSLTPDHLIYVIYTSGSTGKPKGVMLQHKNVADFLAGIDEQLHFQKAHVVAATTNITFDISVLEILGTLCAGKRMVLFDQDALINPELFIEYLNRFKVEVLQVTPSRLKQLEKWLLEEPLQTLKHLIVGGEAFPQDWFNQLDKLPNWDIVNVYGPTETTIWSTATKLNSEGVLSIGKPLKNEQIYVLDDQMQLVPVGIIGEICIGGAGLARGYLNRPELTDEKFVAHPFLENQKLYRTGDLGRWMSDGNLLFTGRKDDQVKLHGNRIELGEIEHVLLTHPSIEQAVVTVISTNQGFEKLIGYYVGSMSLEESVLRNWLRQYLPIYMVPVQFIPLEELPLNSSGKLDRKALPQPNKDISYAGSNKQYTAPRNDIEEKLVKIWEELLERTPIGIYDDFFEIGGHSIIAVKVITQTNKEFDLNMDFTAFFQLRNISELAELIANMQWEKQSMEENQLVDRVVI